MLNCNKQQIVEHALMNIDNILFLNILEFEKLMIFIILLEGFLIKALIIYFI